MEDTGVKLSGEKWVAPSNLWCKRTLLKYEIFIRVDLSIFLLFKYKVSAYAQCLKALSETDDISKGGCEKEFQALKDCFKKCRKVPLSQYLL